jgi:hypothetical protein
MQQPPVGQTTNNIFPALGCSIAMISATRLRITNFIPN